MGKKSRCKRKSKLESIEQSDAKKNKLSVNSTELKNCEDDRYSSHPKGEVCQSLTTLRRDNPVAECFYVLPHMKDLLLSAKLAIFRGNAIVVAGAVGCGKTEFIKNLAKYFHANLKSVQISEQTDAKNLVGGYACTEIPGQFVWCPGPLFTAVTEGRWLLLEDVDRGSSEVEVLLTSIIRNPCFSADMSYTTNLLNPLSGKPIQMHPNFRLLMTRRLIACQTNDLRPEYENPFSDLLDRQICVLVLPSLDMDAVQTLVSKNNPSLGLFMDRVMKIYALVQMHNPQVGGTTSRNRPVSFRDLLRFCSRIGCPSDDEGQANNLLLDAVDCFVAHLSDASKRFTLTCQIGGELNMSIEKVTYSLYRRPILIQVNSNDGVVQLGRASISCERTLDWETKLASSSLIQTPTDSISSSWPFASTRLACALLERLAVAVIHHEPVLLVGETGTGKTTVVQRLAQLCGRRLRVINLNQQSDSVDLLGGFKPVDTRALIRPIREQFESLFCRTFKMETNLAFLGHINTCFNENRWRDLLALMRHPTQLAIARLSKELRVAGDTDDNATATSSQLDDASRINLNGWFSLVRQLDQIQRRLDASVKGNQPALGFAFIEGALVRSIQDGDWVLLDEINLAPPEMLDCLSGLLDSKRGSVTLIERGDKDPLVRSPNFHLFAAMNPSTDVGKRELPVGLRNRFTEFYVPELNPGLHSEQQQQLESAATRGDGLESIRRSSESNDREDLSILVRAYLLGLNPSPAQITTLVRLYAALRQAAVEGLVDGVGQRPHFSLRTLCRALVESGRAYHGSTIRSLYEGLIFSFGSQISRSSRPVLDTIIRRYLSLALTEPGTQTARGLDQLLASPLPAPPTPPDKSTAYVNVEGYWIPRGPNEPRQVAPTTLCDGSYILTPTVRTNLKDLARVVAAGGSLPILLQGETSVGKTSLITYLADRVGQICYRINNHEHTDQQTYLGSYTVASATAQATGTSGDLTNTPPPLVFQEGPLVQAMRAGHWIILDELNLAPTEILEALNRVLDDNRTLFIPETQETIKAHPLFRLFATQNPPGLYAGRKVLSRALRNRFVELHFDPLPRDELTVILEKRCALPASRAHRLVEVLHRLQLARCNSNLFHGKDSFITLRDLFRWAERYRLATCDHQTNEQTSVFFDWDAYLADQGYLLLAGRVRNPAEARTVAEAIEAVFKRPITESRLFDLTADTSAASMEFLKPLMEPKDSNAQSRPNGFEHIVWTRDMRRLLVLVGNALKYQEPVLLVGETGCGKTTVCQLFAALQRQQLHCVNCHQYTEAADFLGALRPIRHTGSQDQASEESNRLFEWVDGPLVTAMSKGDMFLLDEISLADDAVLERLNSLLEPERRIHLTERSELADSTDTLTGNDLMAHPKFRFVATMNPGGDYGKKELSPALRNRFTEIWCLTPSLLAVEVEDKSTLERESRSNSISSALSDLVAIVRHNLQLCLPSTLVTDAILDDLACVMVEFVHWYARKQSELQAKGAASMNRRPQPTIRDLIAWVHFIKSVLVVDSTDHSALCPVNVVPRLDVLSACLHGAALLFLDALEPDMDQMAIDDEPNVVVQATTFLADRLRAIPTVESKLSLDGLELALRYAQPLTPSNQHPQSLDETGTTFGIHPFYIETGSNNRLEKPTCTSFSFDAPTPSLNLRRLLRALQLPQRALLLEGSPGVGKTTLVLALAQATGHPVVRINLSEATEASDLLGCDLPVEGAGPGIFAWRDGPLLQALRHGHWIILDEMNLASQSVLECLNACLDHRGEIYVPELGAKFTIQPKSTRIFACQNPIREGGGRKGLPKSFLNRFTQVYLQPLSTTDQEFILTRLYPTLDVQTIRVMIRFNETLNFRVNVRTEFAAQGGPWEFNLRDLMRWCELLSQHVEGHNPGLYVHLLYVDRMRTLCDKEKVVDLWCQTCSDMGAKHMAYYRPLGRVQLMDNVLYCGLAKLANHMKTISENVSLDRWLDTLALLDVTRGALESLLTVLGAGWMAILVGPPGCGKRSLAHICATLTGRELFTVCLSPNSDTVDLLGSLEQHEDGGLFVWVDSPLVTGIREGHWVMIENAHLCSPSVLDRLNSLLEPGGELIISERGLDAHGQLIRVRPHRDFRLILAVDESATHATVSSGVSRAMRNRGVEIAFHQELSKTELDLTRLLTLAGTPLTLARAISAFQQDLQVLIDLANSQPSANAQTVGHFRRPPVGMILSAGIFASQLLQQPKLDDSPREVLVRHLFPDDHKGSTNATVPIPSSLIKSEWHMALARSLHWLYAARQMSQTAAKFIDDTICQFLQSEVVERLAASEVPTDFHSLTSTLSSPPLLFFKHRLRDVIACSHPDQYRSLFAHCLVMTCASEPSRSLPDTIRLGCRLLWEQADPDKDLTSLLTHQLCASEFSGLRTIACALLDQARVFDGNDDFQLYRWSDWPDSRWIPGYLQRQCSKNLLENWDRHLRMLAVNDLLHTVKSTETSSRTKNGKAVSSNIVLSEIPVWLASRMLSQGELPATWSEVYPGIRELSMLWIQSLKSFVDTSPTKTSRCHNAVDAALDAVQRTGNMWTWLALFGLRAVGSADEWPELFQFHQHRADLIADGNESDHGYRKPALSLLLLPFQSKIPLPRAIPTELSEFSLLTPNWSHFGRKLDDVLAFLRSETTQTDCYWDDDADNNIDSESQFLDTEALTTRDVHALYRGQICLWPLAMLTCVRLTRTQESSLPLQAQARFTLTALTRPRLLLFLSAIQSCTQPVPAQQRAFRNSSTETPDDEVIGRFCSRLDLTSTQRVLASVTQESLDRTSIVGEWRSLTQSIYALTLPVLSHYGLYTHNSQQTLIGHAERHAAMYRAHQLLLTCCTKPTTTPRTLFTQEPYEWNTETLCIAERIIQFLPLVYEALELALSTHPSVTNSDISVTTPSETFASPSVALEWIKQTFLPQLERARPLLSEWSEWADVMHLADLLANFILLLLCPEKSEDKAADSTLCGLCWLVFGCLHLKCMLPHSPMDPYLVHQIEQEAVSLELGRIDSELDLRHRMRMLLFGTKDYGLQQETKGEGYASSCLRALADAGLEHPWYAALIIYREQLADKACKLASLNRNSVVNARCSSNREYGQLRRRLLAFVCGFTDQFLLPKSHKIGTQDALSHLSLCNILRWTEITADLCEWLTEPERANHFADIVEPFLDGLLRVNRGLQMLTHCSLSTGSAKSTAITSVMQLLTTSLLTGGGDGDVAVHRKISIACPSVPLWLATQLTQPDTLNTIRDVSGTAFEVQTATRNVSAAAQAEFRVHSMILDLIWLHLLELRFPPADNGSMKTNVAIQFLGRLIAFVTRPVARRWRLAEAERKRMAAERAALFIEAASRKQRLRDQLQQADLSIGKNKRSRRDADESADLVDPGLDEEVDWRLRFPETASLAAVAELNATGVHGGLGKEDRIQQAVHHIEAVDTWLRESLERSRQTWLPNEAELTHFVLRLINLLLARPHWHTHRSLLESSIVDTNTLNWRWYNLLGGYSLASSLLFNSGLSLDPAVDNPGLPVHLAVLAHLTETDVRNHQSIPQLTEEDGYQFTGKAQTPMFDVYRDPIPLDACTRLRGVLSNLERRVRQLLQDWPGQPSLVRLLILLQRIEAFRVSDPLVKFITGLELIWQEIHEWEKNAARHVSLMDHSKEVCELLIEWRKIELKCWIATLDTAETAISNRALSIWFHLHDLFLRPSPSNAKTIASAETQTEDHHSRCLVLVELMENGPLGEFLTRWRLLVALYSALSVWPGLSEQDVAAAERVVGNVIWFYSQFVPFVQQEIVRLRQPIEKELKGVVSITKWGDYTRFWSVKSNVDRCKKTIHKQIKNWETILRRPVRPLFESAVRIPNLIGPCDTRSPAAEFFSQYQSCMKSMTAPILSSDELTWLSELRNCPNVPVYIRRLPVLISRFCGHVDRIAQSAPALDWTQQLAQGTQSWLSLIADLQACTRELEANCPASHVLNQLRAQKSGQSAGRHAVDPETLDAARQWHQKFTALQQRKRLALTQWFKVASKSRNHSDGGGFVLTDDCEPDSDPDLPSTLRNFDDSCTPEDGRFDDVSDANLVETDQLPQLGLSYRRGQRHSQTGSMTSFLSSLTGSPWAQTQANVQKQSTDDTHAALTIKLSRTVCDRTARLLALRASLPRVPGPVDASPEMVAAVVADLGGPDNLARLIGLADDLVNQCTQAFASCAELTRTAEFLEEQTLVHEVSLPVEVDRTDAWDCFRGCDRIQLHRIQQSVYTIGQLTQDALIQWTLFWSACANSYGTPNWPTNADLQQVVGSGLWLSVVHPHIRSHPLDQIGRLAEHIRARFTEINTAATSVFTHTSALLQSRVVVLPPSWMEQAECLEQSVNRFVQLFRDLLVMCDSTGFHSSICTTIDLVCERLRVETSELHDVLGTCLMPSGQCTEKCSPVFDDLSDRLVRSILATLEILHKADKPANPDSNQIDCLLHFSRTASHATRLVRTRLGRCLTRWSSALQVGQQQVQDGIQFAARLRMARVIMPLLHQLTRCCRVRASQFWLWLDTWTRLGEIMLRVTGQLLTDGFCRPAGMLAQGSDSGGESGAGTADSNQAPSDACDASTGATSLSAQGVDTTGAKDVSNEIECQEQVEGLMHDNDQTSAQDEDGSKGDDDGQGIEMPDDFAGQLQDAPIEPETPDSDDKEEQGDRVEDDLENRLNSGNELSSGQDDDGLSKEMWASEDEDDERDEGTKKDLPTEEAGGVEDKTDPLSKSESHDDGKVQQKPETSQTEGENPEEPTCQEAENEQRSADPKGSRNLKGSNRRTVAGKDDDITLDEMEFDQDTQEDEKQDEQMRAEVETMHLEQQDIEQVPDEKSGDEPLELPEQSMDIEDANETTEPNLSTGEGDGDEGEPEPEPGETNEQCVDRNGDHDPAQTESELEAFPYHPGSGDLKSNPNASGAEPSSSMDSQDTPTQAESHPEPMPNAGESLDRVGQPIPGSRDTGPAHNELIAPISQTLPGLDQKDRTIPAPHPARPKQLADQHGPRPTSDNRCQDLSTLNSRKPIRGFQLLEANMDDHNQTESCDTTSDLYQHLPDKLTAEDADSQMHAYDSATREQRDRNKPNEEAGSETKDGELGQESDRIDVQSDRLHSEPVNELPAASTSVFPTPVQPFGDSSQQQGTSGSEISVQPDPTAESVPTLSAQRPPESVICSRPELVAQSVTFNQVHPNLDELLVERERGMVSLDSARGALLEWVNCTQRSASLARQLCEALRLVLEPTKAARLRGDYRTGKRINMRKIIPYLASQFRKDKIWLRRSQPSQREYRILVAVDDSSSMSDNLCRQMTFDALATVVTALNLLEVGQIGVCSFGESVRVLHDLSETWVGDAGPNVLARFTFQQSRTSIVQLLHSAVKLMQASMSSVSTSSLPSQLLLILSDGVFSEDPLDPAVQAAVRLARDSRLFLVCLILDDVRKKHSIFDLRRYTTAGKLTPYMDTFPLPYYVVLRDVTALPHLLADALRQWFELESSMGC